MRSFHSVGLSRIALLAILLAGYMDGVFTLPTIVTQSEGEEFEAAVLTFDDVVKECYLITPNDNTVGFKPIDESDDKFQLLEDKDLWKCRVMVRRLNEKDTGLWILNSVNDKGLKRSQSYQVTVNGKPDVETTTPFPDGDQEVKEEYLTELRFDTVMGATHTIGIPKFDFVTTESCHLITPNGDRVNLESIEIPGIETFNDLLHACGVIVHVNQEDVIGTWHLISRETRLGSDVFERKLPFTINVEEKVNAMPGVINVIEGNDFYVRLENPSSDPETCILLTPDGNKYEDYDADPRYVDTCGFIVRSVGPSGSGEWRIVYGKRKTYSASFNVIVGTNGEKESLEFVWTREHPVQEVFGPEDAIYCKVYDPANFVVFEGFGRCNVSLPRATNSHAGNWRMFIGLSGHVLTQESAFTVYVVGESSKSNAVTTVTMEKPIVTLSCNVSCPYPIRACKFRAPNGRILIANPGVGEDQYSFHGKGSRYESGVHTHDCGIQITNPRNRDLGLWRCAIETRNETYYGFLSALWPWAMRDPEVAAGVITEPTLTADRELVEAVEGDNVLMSCSVQSAIRYCYFRASNGTVYNVGPGGSSTDLGDYAGAGLDAGECSIRFRSLQVADSGPWSCHVGFHEFYKSEHRANFSVQIKDIMVVNQTEAQINVAVEGREIDYCRFVRIDGFGFTSDAELPGYIVSAFPQSGQCILRGLESSNLHLDRRPWTVIARISGQGREISRTTNGAPPPSLFPCPLPVFWLLFMILGVSLIMSAALVGPRKHRRWVYERASNIHSSFRQSFAKKAVNEQTVSDKTTANAA